MMEKRPLGTAGLEASLVGLGCNNFGMKIDLAASRAVINAALDAGITFFDTADMYGNGQSEEFIGQELGPRRKEIVLATKFGGVAMMRKSGERWGMRAYIVACLEASLRRLRTEWVDLYQMHYPDPTTPIEETLAALDELVRQGKVRAVGCSNFSGAQIAEAEAKAKESHVTHFVTAQNEWSLLIDDPAGQKLNFPTNCAFGGPGLQDLYIANVEGDHFSRVHTSFHGHPLYHQR